MLIREDAEMRTIPAGRRAGNAWISGGRHVRMNEHRSHFGGLRRMQAATLRQARDIARDVLLSNLSYRQAGSLQGISRSTAERQFKTVVRLAASQTPIGRLNDLELGSLALLRAARDDVLRAVDAYDPGRSSLHWNPDSNLELDSAARRVRIQSGNAARDVALLLLSISTGARPLEIARLRVSDYLDAAGHARDGTATEARPGGRCAAHRVSFAHARLRAALDAYLDERKRHGLGVDGRAAYRGLRADSMLFLTKDGRPFAVKARACNDPHLECPVLGAVVRRVYAQAGLTSITTNVARRHLAQRLILSGATHAEVCDRLGLAHQRSVSRLVRQAVSAGGPPRMDAG